MPVRIIRKIVETFLGIFVGFIGTIPEQNSTTLKQIFVEQPGRYRIENPVEILEKHSEYQMNNSVEELLEESLKEMFETIPVEITGGSNVGLLKDYLEQILQE